MKAVNTRYPDDVHARITAAAKVDHRSFNGEVIELIERGLEARQQARHRRARPTALHHINGNPYDNRPENLQVVDLEAHVTATPTNTEETQP